MEKISPLRAGLDAFNKFKASRLQSKNNENTNNNSTNPFGISFKGAVLQMDVFEKSSKDSADNSASVTNPISSVGKFVASARAATMNKIESIKQGAISFGNKVKENISNTYNMLTQTEVSFDIFGNSVSRLQKRPVGELEEMFKNELSVKEA